MSAELQQSYDTFPYQSFSFPQSHPDRLATIGELFGMTPVPIARSRVLELGCASGGNLIPVAATLPVSLGTHVWAEDADVVSETVKHAAD